MVNALFSTKIYAIFRMAQHITEVMTKVDVVKAGPDLVEKLAVVPQGAKAHRRHHSFASKFAHFFVDAEKYPIMDSYAEGMIKLHLGRGRLISDPVHPYSAYCHNYLTLKAEAGFQGSNRQMDHYLWFAGLYLAWRKDPTDKINMEARKLFENDSSEVSSELDALMPSILSKAFRGEL